jgi:hypothetical protein
MRFWRSAAGYTRTDRKEVYILNKKQIYLTYGEK